jgi:lycopene beta-cyclase
MLNIALIGAGLHNLMLALWLHDQQQRCAQPRRESRIWLELFERQSEIPTNRTISAHQSDIPLPMQRFMQRYTRRSWDSYLVSFGGSRQTVPLGYITLDLNLIRDAIMQLEQEGKLRIHLGRAISADNLPPSTLGTPFHVCIDSAPKSVYSPAASAPTSPADPSPPQGVQQFFGRTYRFSHSHGCTVPIIMDARVSQPPDTGFRFIYLLPESNHDLLIEDTRLIPTPVAMSELEDWVSHKTPELLEKPQCTDSHDSESQFAATRELLPEVTHTECGIIPIPLHPWTPPSEPGDHRTSSGCRVIAAGLAAGYFNPTTGYSLPHSLRSILALSRDLSPMDLAPENASNAPLSFTHFHSFARAAQSSWPAYHLFNLLLFHGFPPGRASYAFAYFYSLPKPFIQKFYSGQLRLRDMWIFLLRRAPKHFLFRRIPLIAARFIARYPGHKEKERAYCSEPQPVRAQK